MKIKYYLLLFSFFAISMKAQKTKSILYLKDGTKLIGFGELSGLSSVKFKKNKKIIYYNFNDFKKIEIYKDEIEFKTYLILQIEGRKKPKIMEEVIKGKVSLYLQMIYGNSPNFTNGIHNSGKSLFKIEPVGIKNYYVKKEGNVKVKHLGSTHLFSKNFRKAALIYFKDCSSLVEKLKNKRYKKKDIKNIIEYYNKNCN